MTLFVCLNIALIAAVSYNMANPIVDVDLSTHPYHVRYNGGHCKAEILMLNTNTGNMRVRLIHPNTNEVILKSIDISMSYIVGSQIVIDLYD